MGLLDGKVALITGAGGGLGEAYAKLFAREGAAVVVNDLGGPRDGTGADLSMAQKVVDAIKAEGGRAVANGADISTMAGIDMLANEFGKREPKLDILVNNAGAAWGADFDEFPESGWDKVMNLNVKTPFFLTKALSPRLRAAASAERPAKVINIASIDGLFVNPLETYSYQASKAGLIHLTRRMAAKLIGDHVIVTGIAPGAFASEMNRAARDHADEVSIRVPAGRIGTAEDMAGAAIFLASRAGDYVVGTTLAVDGGVVYAKAGAEIAG